MALSRKWYMGYTLGDRRQPASAVGNRGPLKTASQQWAVCRVRAGVRDVETAQGYVDTAIAYGLLPRDASRRISLVECDVSDPDTLVPAIGNAAKVGAILSSEKAAVLPRIGQANVANHHGAEK